MSASALALGKSGLLTTLEPSSTPPASTQAARIDAKEVTVYTTAANTEYKLPATAKVAFNDWVWHSSVGATYLSTSQLEVGPWHTPEM